MEGFGLGLQISLVGVLIVSLALASIPLVVKIIELLVMKLKLDRIVSTKQIKRLEDDQMELTEEEIAAICGAISTYLSDEKQEYRIKSISKIE
ncbi:hypothetical protein MWH28_05905 [Natroniella sulfidigena]|uniref:hypothetical protein n=1 Tax=Natroniella sulfidigena TaxID=723921 RepID=UPI00200A40FE|nr:hypothetical protein [Natroniella sulfidigena]MCK8816907.1 hypothetical protein [Natroniella sulfidigena]